MKLSQANAIFFADDDGIMVITDINNKPEVTFGELVYDGGNIAFLNRDNKECYALQNIPPELRGKILKAKKITVIEHNSKDDIYAYSVIVRIINNLNLPDEWDKFAQNTLDNLSKTLSVEEFSQIDGMFSH